MATRPRFAAALLVVAWFGTGCSWLIDAGRDQCSSDADCTAAGLPGSCVQGVCAAVGVFGASKGTCDGGESCDDSPPPASEPEQSTCSGMRCDEGEICFKDQCAVKGAVERFVCDAPEHEVTDTVRVEMRLREFVSGEPPQGLVVTACRPQDVDCTAPVLTWEDPDGQAEFVLDLPYGFDGFLEMRSDDALTSLWYFTQRLVTAPKPIVLPVPSPDTLTLLASIAGFEPDERKGLVILEVFDCAGITASGIHFEESNHEALPFFIIDQLPNIDSTVTVHDDRDNSAAGGFFNATPDFTIFSARLGVDGPLLGTFNANVRANTVTYLGIYP